MSIELNTIINKEFVQNCGDTLRVLKKTSEKKNGNFLWECEFLKYPYKILALKDSILKGKVLNPQIEQKEFVEKLWKQNCGDILKVIQKTSEKSRNEYLWECEFINYPCKVFVLKQNIVNGKVLNPQIENVEFKSKLWDQNCGDTLRIIQKIDKKKKNEFLWECEFTKYPCKVLGLKSDIIAGNVDNPNLPWRKKETLEKYLKENFDKPTTLTTLSKKLNISLSTIGKAINEFDLRDYINYDVSYSQIQIEKYINSLGVECYSKTFGKENSYREIDIFIPKFNIGFEYNGNYWHSNIYKENNYHQDKTLNFKEKENIRTYHIFEYEWLQQEEKLKYWIKTKLGFFDKKIFARDCCVKLLYSDEYQDFCEKNHIQNSAGAKVKLGLFYKKELVQIISFGVPRFTTKFEWEIIRECSKLGYFIIGGKEKLWKYFVKNYNPNNCISYCDFSKFDGKSYIKIGFEKSKLNKPGFVWYDKETNQTFWRNPHKNKEMQQRGYFKIYDCGQLVFTWFKGQKDGK